jgi:DNA-binding response OmpR family regulator
MSKKPVVLVVDDSPVTAKQTQVLLSSIGYEVVTRESSTRAISYIGNHEVDLIIMDIELMGSRYDGIETSKIIRSKYSIPVIFITGKDDSSIFEEANISNVYDVLIKPYNIEQLRMHIEVTLQNNKIEQRYKELDFWFDSFLATVDYGVYFVNTDGKIVKINQKAEEQTGYTRNSAIGLKFLDIAQIAFDNYDNNDLFFFVLDMNELLSNIGNRAFLIVKDNIPTKIEVRIIHVNNKNTSMGYIVEVKKKQ